MTHSPCHELLHLNWLALLGNIANVRPLPQICSNKFQIFWSNCMLHVTVPRQSSVATIIKISMHYHIVNANKKKQSSMSVNNFYMWQFWVVHIINCHAFPQFITHLNRLLGLDMEAASLVLLRKKGLVLGLGFQLFCSICL